MTVHLSTLSSTGDRGTPTGNGNYYVSMSTWEAAAQGFHQAGDQTILECYRGTTTTGAWQANGDYLGNLNAADWSNLTATDNAIVRAADGESHGGVHGVGFTMIESYGNANSVIIANIPHLTVRGFTVENTRTGTSGSRVVDIQDFGNDILIDQMCIRMIGTSTLNAAVRISRSTSNTTIRNSRLEGGVDTLLYNEPNAGGVVVENCTFVSIFGGGTGFYAPATPNAVPPIAKNTAVVGYTESFRNGGTFDEVNSTNNAVDDAFNIGQNQINGVVTTDGVDFIEPSTGNYNPQPTGKLDGAGVDLSGTFTEDITGATRTQWDVGAYGIISGAPTFADTNAFTITIAASGISLTVAGIENAQELDTVSLVASAVVNLAEVTQAQELNQPEITQAYLVAPSALEQGQELDPVPLITAGLLALAAIEQGHELGDVALSQDYGELTLSALEQAQNLGDAELTTAIQLLLASVEQAQELQDPSITLAGFLNLAGIEQAQIVDSVALDQANLLNLSEMTQEQVLSAVRLGGLVIGTLDGTLTIFSSLDGEFTIHGAGDPPFIEE